MCSVTGYGSFHSPIGWRFGRVRGEGIFVAIVVAESDLHGRYGNHGVPAREVEDNQSVRSCALILIIATAAAMTPEAKSAKAKLSLIMDNKARRGSTVIFTPRELEEWAKIEVPTYVPEGFRAPRVHLGYGTADGYALMDFKKLRHARGAAPSWMDNLIDGERPVKVSVAVRSGNGWCTVDLKRLEISGVAASGTVLDLLIKTFFLSLYPNAKINEPFELDYRIDRIDVRPNGLHVTIKK